MAAKDDLGREGEQWAADHLRALGYDILERNWRCPQGEIDIIATIGFHLAIVEVKTRRSDRFGHPLEAVDRRKSRRLWRLAGAWVSANPERARGRVLRLEVIGIIGDDRAAAVIDHLVDLR